MGFFDRLAGKKPAPSSSPAPEAAPTGGSAAPTKTVKSQLDAAREKLEAKDLAAAIAIYEELLAGSAGDRADVLVAISGDLGSRGYVAQIVELISPRYDADRHGPATGLNLIQAYLALRDPDSAQHVLDILFSLNRPELEERLHGFSNAIAEILAAPNHQPLSGTNGSVEAPGVPKIGLVTITKPIWFYGLESLAAQILPPKEGRLRRIAFAQLALPGFTHATDGAKTPEEELPRLSRAIPLWFAETFYFCPSYNPLAALGVMTPPQGESHYIIFGAEWTTENLRQLVDTTEGGLDYIVTGTLRATGGDYELALRIWDVKGYRDRKNFLVRWTPATADTALLEIHGQLRTYMEWSPTSAAFAFTLPTQPRPWLETLGASLGLFLVDKGVIGRAQLRPAPEDLQHAAARAATSEGASFAFLTLKQRAAKLQLGDAPEATLARSPLVNEVRKITG